MGSGHGGQIQKIGWGRKPNRKNSYIPPKLKRHPLDVVIALRPFLKEPLLTSKNSLSAKGIVAKTTKNDITSFRLESSQDSGPESMVSDSLISRNIFMVTIPIISYSKINILLFLHPTPLRRNFFFLHPTP